jgi:hypothetical protein
MLSESETRLAVAELKERFYEDVPAIVLVWPEAIRAADRQFRILEPSNPDIFTYVGQWRRESPALASK